MRKVIIYIDSHRRHFFGWLERKSNLNIIYKTVAIIFVWCGLWGFMEELIFPNHPLLRYGTSLAIGLFLLYIDDFSLSELSDLPGGERKENKDKKSEE